MHITGVNQKSEWRIHAEYTLNYLNMEKYKMVLRIMDIEKKVLSGTCNGYRNQEVACDSVMKKLGRKTKVHNS